MKKPDWMAPQGPKWTHGPGRLVYENPWIRVTEYKATAPTGAAAVYGVVGFKNFAIAVLPIHEDGTVTLVGQHRFVSGDYSWELPEGGGPTHIDPLESARRELAEETGLAAAEWREVLRMELSNSVTDEIGIGFVATGLSAAAGEELDPTEDLRVARRPFREALDLAVSGHMPDSLTVAMLLRAYHMAREGQLPAALTRAMLG
jgi:8-oxo-dGTP pyrophosphatase MutT (NUDIX family)